MRLSRICALVVVAFGAVVCWSWWADYSPGKNIVPGTVTVKFPTALAFVVSGIMWFVASFRGDMRRDVAVSALSMLLFAGMFAVSVAVAAQRESAFIMFADRDLGIETTRAGFPSGCTALLFIFSALAAQLWLHGRIRLAYALAVLIFVGGFVALVGHLVKSVTGMDTSWMYCHFSGRSTAMAVLTAALNCVTGIAIAWRSDAGRIMQAFGREP